ncbi:hypothetical protein HZS_6819, partial [Henneguya salminicola]
MNSGSYSNQIDYSHIQQQYKVVSAHDSTYNSPTLTDSQIQNNQNGYFNQNYVQPLAQNQCQPNYNDQTYNSSKPFNQPTYSYDPNYNKNPNDYNKPLSDVNKLHPLEDKKKIGSDVMPHPINAYYRDYQKYYGTTFDTTIYTTPPPFVSTLNVYYTGYKNCTPNFMRSSIYGIPNNAETLKKSGLPLCLIITPFCTENSFEMPLVEHGREGPVRCRRCRTYVNPYIQFLNGGKNYRCNICECINDVPEHYFCNLDQTGERLDYLSRPELLYGSYDMSTNDDYCRHNNPQTHPKFIFMFDVSYCSISSGMLKHVTSTLSNIISSGFFDNLSGDLGLKIGIMTYDSQIHVFCPKKDDPEMEIIFDIDEPFVSSLNSFAVDPVEYKEALIKLLKKIPQIFENNKTVDVMLGPVIAAASDAIVSLQACAKFFIFHGNLPTMDTQGKLVHKTERSQLGTEDDKKILTPQTNFYSVLANKCVDNGIGIDLYLFPNGPVEVASLSPLCSLTGGNLRLYKYFKANSHGNTLSYDLQQNIRSEIGLDSMAKLRCSNGLSVKEFIGNFTVVNESEILMSTIDENKSFCVEIKYDDKINGAVAYYQFALLYTSPSGKRLIRVHNLALNVIDNITDIFKFCDQDTISHYFYKYLCKNILIKSILILKQELINDLIRILICYRQNCSPNSSPQQLILPEYLKLLPLYINSFLNSDCINGGREIPPDDKSYSLYFSLSCTLKDTNSMFYPRLLDVLSMISINEQINESQEGYSCEYCLPNGIIQIRSSYERLNSTKIYLLENGINIFIWMGKQIDPNIYYNLFGNENTDQFDGVVLDHLPSIDSQLSISLSNLIAQIRKLRCRFLRIYICQQDHKSEYFFKKYLCEDRGGNSNNNSNGSNVGASSSLGFLSDFEMLFNFDSSTS